MSGAPVTLNVAASVAPLFTGSVEDRRDRAVEVAERDLDGDTVQASDEAVAFLLRHCPLERHAALEAYYELRQAVDDRRRLECGELYPWDYCGSSDPSVADDQAGSAISQALSTLFPIELDLAPALAVGL